MSTEEILRLLDEAAAAGTDKAEVPEWVREVMEPMIACQGDALPVIPRMALGARPSPAQVLRLAVLPHRSLRMTGKRSGSLGASASLHLHVLR